MSGVPPSSPTKALAASVMLTTSSGSRSRSWSSWSLRRNGSATTGPVPGTMSRSTPTALSGTTMSEKKIAASTPYRRTGWRVISTTMSVRKHDSSIGTPSRMARYSGSERPAWRMNQTGTWSAGSPRHARKNGLSARVTVSIVSGRVSAGERCVDTRMTADTPTITGVGVRSEIDRTPPAFTAAVEQVGRAVLRPEVVIDTMPARQRIAPFAHAVSGDVRAPSTGPGRSAGGEELGTGRFILLHDPAGNDAWGGTFRCVTFARADVEPEMAADPSLPTVGWSWLTDALESHGGGYIAPSGSVTVVHTEGFGEMAADGSDAQIEVRASWTPSSDDMGAHISAWSDLLCAIAGLPPLAPGVIPLQPRRRGTR